MAFISSIEYRAAMRNTPEAKASRSEAAKKGWITRRENAAKTQ